MKFLLVFLTVIVSCSSGAYADSPVFTGKIPSTAIFAVDIGHCHGLFTEKYIPPHKNDSVTINWKNVKACAFSKNTNDDLIWRSFATALWATYNDTEIDKPAIPSSSDSVGIYMSETFNVKPVMNDPNISPTLKFSDGVHVYTSLHSIGHDIVIDSKTNLEGIPGYYAYPSMGCKKPNRRLIVDALVRNTIKITCESIPSNN